jgi:hypothetical protein
MDGQWTVNPLWTCVCEQVRFLPSALVCLRVWCNWQHTELQIRLVRVQILAPLLMNLVIRRRGGIGNALVR